MKRNWRGMLIIGCFLTASYILASNPTTGWQEAKNIAGNFRAVSAQPEIEVFTAPNIIRIKVNHESEVRIFSILGKLISSQKLSPGVYYYNFDTHGIFIIKTENSSCKIAI